MTYKMIIDLRDPNRPCFTKQEVRDILFERNELKANLFLVQEELTFYQRWEREMLAHTNSIDNKMFDQKYIYFGIDLNVSGVWVILIKYWQEVHQIS